MKMTDPIKLIGQVLDLPIIDKDGRWCGIVDDVELVGGPGKPCKIKALLVGPGAYEARMPGWMFWIVRKIAGDRIVRVPIDEVASVGSAIKLKSTGTSLNLTESEDRVRRWIPRKGAM